MEIVKTYPCTNIFEVATFAAQQHGSDPQQTFDASSVIVYVWENSEDDSAQAVVQELLSGGFLSPNAGPVLSEILDAAAPLRQSARVASTYLQIGSPLFVSLRGTVDVRCIFHKTADDYRYGKPPTEIVDTQQVVIANLVLLDSDEEEQTVPFLMDETDLRAMRRFVNNMEKELELAKSLAGKS